MRKLTISDELINQLIDLYIFVVTLCNIQLTPAWMTYPSNFSVLNLIRCLNCNFLLLCHMCVYFIAREPCLIVCFCVKCKITGWKFNDKIKTSQAIVHLNWLTLLRMLMGGRSNQSSWIWSERQCAKFISVRGANNSSQVSCKRSTWKCLENQLMELIRITLNNFVRNSPN